LIERELLSPTLGIFRFALDGGVPPFEAGQYLILGLPVDGKLVWRPFSVASPPEETRFVEFLVRWVVHPVEGVFTTRFGRLREGDLIRWKGPQGRFTIRERLHDGRPDRRRLLLVAAGTGVAPFASYLGHLQAADDGREVVLVQGASYADELAYRQRFEELARQGRLEYLPTISRPEELRNQDWSGGTGRVERWLELPAPGAPCELERALSIQLAPADTCAYLCGSDGMVRAARAALEARGFGAADVAWEAYA